MNLKHKKVFLSLTLFLIVALLPLEHYRRSRAIIGRWRPQKITKSSVLMVLKGDGTFEDRTAIDGVLFASGKYRFWGLYYLELETTDYWIHGENGTSCQPNTKFCPVNCEDGLFSYRVFAPFDGERIGLQSRGMKLKPSQRTQVNWLIREAK